MRLSLRKLVSNLIFVLVAGAAIVATEHTLRKVDPFEKALDFAIIAYPELAKRSDLLVWYETPKTLVAELRDRPGVRRGDMFSLLIDTADAFTAEHHGRPAASHTKPAPVFGAVFRIDVDGRIVGFVLGRSKIVDMDRLDRLREENERLRPRERQAAIESTLRGLGAEYPPSQRDRLRLAAKELCRSLKAFIGPIQINSVEFESARQAEAAFAEESTSILWIVKGVVERSELTLVLEPLNGRLISLNRSF